VSDGAAFDVAELWEREYPAVVRYFRRRLGPDHQLAPDLAAEVFLRAWAKRDTYRPRPGTGPMAWIYRIARNLLIDHRRARRPAVSLDVLEWRDLAPSCSYRFEEIGTRLEIGRALDALTEKQRAVLVARFWVGRQHTECGHIATADGSKKLQDRALANLKRLLQKEVA
jgi:RNA polymerase sigma-70 factor (ECF subfamily)